MKTLPSLTLAGIKKAFGIIPTRTLKETAFSFLPEVDGVSLAEKFWQEKFNGVGEWYLKQKREDDVIVSASPEFLLKPVAQRLQVTIIGTRMDPSTGKISGENCHDREKISRFYECFPEGHIDNFYSDSNSDLPLARLADHAWKLKHYQVSEWKITDKL